MASDFQAIISLIGIGGGLVFHAVRSHRRIRHIADTPRSKAESAPQGFVELEGFAWPAAEVFRNSNNQDAVYYSMSVQKEETRGSGKSRRKVWVTLYTHVHSDMFYLVDATGLVALDTTTAELNLESARTRYWGKMTEREKNQITAIVPPDISGFPPSKAFFGLFGGNYRVVENEILVGSPLYASGDFRSFNSETYAIKLDGLTAFGDKVFDKAARALKNRNHMLDSNRDGKITSQELRNGSIATARVARDKARSDVANEAEVTVHGNLGSSDQSKLFLADTFEEQLKSRMSKWLWPKFGAGAAMVALGLGLMIVPNIKNKLNRAKETGTSITASQNTRVTQALIPRKPANENYAKARLSHDLCIKGQAAACTFLLSHQSELRLSPQYVQYYESKLSTMRR